MGRPLESTLSSWWRSQFPGLLIKCLWYALDTHLFSLNVRSVLWGIGCKGYPRKWWLGTLQRFWSKYALHDVICMAQLIAWVRQGALHTPGDFSCNTVT